MGNGQTGGTVWMVVELGRPADVLDAKGKEEEENKNVSGFCLSSGVGKEDLTRNKFQGNISGVLV